MLCKIPWCLEMSFRWQFWSPELRDLTMVRLVYGWIKESGAHNSRVDYQFTIGHSWSPHRGPGHPMDRSRVSRPISAWESADQSQSQTHKSERDRGKAAPGEGRGRLLRAPAVSHQDAGREGVWLQSASHKQGLHRESISASCCLMT